MFYGKVYEKSTSRLYKKLIFYFSDAQKLFHSSFIKNTGEKIYFLKSTAVFFLHMSPTYHRGDITIYPLLMLSVVLSFSNAVLKEFLVG